VLTRSAVKGLGGVAVRMLATLMILLLEVFVVGACALATRPTVTQPPGLRLGHTPTDVPSTAAAPATVAAAQVVSDEVAAGEVLVGHWEGEIAVAGQRIGIALDFALREGQLVGIMDVPEQGAAGIPLRNLRLALPQVHFEAFEGLRLATFEGRVVGEELSGSFSQVGFSGTFRVRRLAQAQEALPYRQEEVTFTSGGLKLAGTLTLPEGDGPFPAVILISGSGAQTRDEDIFGFKVFRRLADHLTRNGIAVLRYDDRGVGGSEGNLLECTTACLAEDARAAVAFLQGRPEIDRGRIGLLGHSEGGLVAAMVAASSADVSFVVLLAGPSLPGEEILKRQLALIMRAQGASEEDIARAQERQARTFAAVRTGAGWEELRTQMEAEIRAAVLALPEEQRKALGDLDEFVRRSAAEQLAQVQAPWFRFFLDYDPRPDLQMVRVPVLALYGERDLQVPAEANAAALREALRAGGNAAFDIFVIPEANHLFQRAITGAPDEYAKLEKDFAPGVLELIARWILGLAAR